MRRVFPFALFAFSAVALSLVNTGANATDISNHDAVGYTLMVTTSDGTKTIEIDPNSDLADVCDGCEIFMEDGQMVNAKAPDVVSILAGELSISE